MASDDALFGSVETSVFHGFGASKSWPESVVVVPPTTVVGVTVVVDDEVELDDELVVGRDVELEVDVEVEAEVDVVLGRDVVVDDEVEVVVGRVVDDDVELDDELEVVVGTLVVVGLVDVEEVDDEDDDVVALDEVELLVEVLWRVDVLVVEVDVVVVFFRLAEAVVAPAPHVQLVHGSPPAHGTVVSHCSPASASRRPSPHVDASAVR